MPSPTVLFYSPAPASFGPKLLQICAIQGLKLRAVENASLGRPLSTLVQGLPPAEPPAGGSPLPEPLLVFCHLSEGQLDRVLQALRRAQVRCLKAVLTPTNAGWSLEELYHELCKERSQLGGAHPSNG